ncbi:hypothetical protein [Ekhidna sp.]|uniref:hypothetical protein n=1 Tax=Ekhidna sp. TaxID=2608089 RepID=UPI003B50C499
MTMKFLVILFSILLLNIDASAHPAYGIVVDQEQNIYFTDIHHNGRGSVWKLYKSGELELILGDFHAHNISMDEFGFLYTAHGEGTQTMVRISDNGIDTIYSSLDPKKFFGGNATYNKGRILFGLDHFLWKIDNGNKVKMSDHYFEWNQSIYAAPDGKVYASDKALKQGSIIEIDEEGCSKIIASNLITKLNRPIDKHNDVILGVTKGCDGAIYGTETAGQRVFKINEDRSNETFYRPSDGWTPVGLDFFSGDAYVLEYDLDNNRGPRITKIKEDRTLEIVFEYE